MQAVKSAHILTVAAGLTTEACRVGTILNGKLGVVEYDIAIEIGYGNLSGGDEIEVVLINIVHLSLLVGQLTCSVTRSLVHYIGWLHFKITGLTGFVKEELDESALQACTLPRYTGNPAPVIFTPRSKSMILYFRASSQ